MPMSVGTQHILTVPISDLSKNLALIGIGSLLKSERTDFGSILVFISKKIFPLRANSTSHRN